MGEGLEEQVAKLEKQVAELAVCCKSCTNRLDKLENWGKLGIAGTPGN